jgi:hypothetical protein
VCFSFLLQTINMIAKEVSSCAFHWLLPSTHNFLSVELSNLLLYITHMFQSGKHFYSISHLILASKLGYDGVFAECYRWYSYKQMTVVSCATQCTNEFSKFATFCVLAVLTVL